VTDLGGAPAHAQIASHKKCRPTKERQFRKGSRDGTCTRFGRRPQDKFRPPAQISQAFRICPDAPSRDREPCPTRRCRNPKATDLRWSLRNWSATKLGCMLTDAEVDAIIDDVEHKRTRRRFSADNLGRWLGLAFEVRKALRITTIGSIDVNKRARKALRKKWDRAYQAAKRRARGVRPQSESLSATQPWRELGMSRRTWYRRNKERNGTVGTTSSAAIFISCDDKTVPPTTKAAASPSAREDGSAWAAEPRRERLGQSFESDMSATFERESLNTPRRRRGKEREVHSRPRHF